MPTITSENAAQALVQMVAAEALPILVGELRMANLVNRNFENLAADKGQTVNIEIPPVLAANNLAENGTVQTQNPEPAFAQVRLAYHRETTVKVSDMMKVLHGDATIDKYLQPAMVAIAEAVESDLMKLYPQLLSTAGATNAAFSEAALDSAETTLAKNKVTGTRYAALHPDVYSTARNIPRFSEVDKIGSGSAIVTGQIGELKGVNCFRSQYAIKDGSNVYHSPVFTRDAFALVVRPMPKIYHSAVRVAPMNFEGLSARVLWTYDGNQLGEQMTIDILYGCAVLRPNAGVDLVSNA